MKYTQNDKIKQITSETLIIGIDVASKEHYARAFDYRGIEYGKCLRLSDDTQGFEAFTLWARGLATKLGKSDTVVGLEPTGHYWFHLAQLCKDLAMTLVLVNPFHVNRSKELDDNNPTKNDRKDPKIIAMLVKDGRYLVPYMPEGVFSELRTAMNARWRLVRNLTAVGNQIQRWLSIYFPEFNEVFVNWEGKTAQLCLRNFPMPSQVMEQGVEGIMACIKQAKIRGEGSKRAQRLFNAATQSVGARDGHKAACEELIMLLEEYDLLVRQEKRVMEIVKELVSQIPGSDKVLQIDGLGLVTVAGFLAEVGDISRFDHPRQIQKFAGLNLKENSSGKHKGETTISTRISQGYP